MKHPDRTTWYLAVPLAVLAAAAIAAAVFFGAVIIPILAMGKDAEMWWPWFGIPLGSLLALLSLVSMKFLPDLAYRALGGRRP